MPRHGKQTRRLFFIDYASMQLQAQKPAFFFFGIAAYNIQDHA
jgi:hypothetical protein